MTSPSAPIDSSVVIGSPDIMYVLEADGIWKTTNLKTAGAATWTKIWDSASYEGGEFGGLLRVKAPETNLVYAIGWGEDAGGINKPFCLRSSDGGVSWAQNTVDDGELAERDYTVTYRAGTVYHPDDSEGYNQVHFHDRVGDDENTYNPWAIATREYSGQSPGGAYLDWGHMYSSSITIPNFDAGMPFTNSVIYGYANSLLPNPNDGIAYLDDCFGVGGYTWHGNGSMPLNENRVEMIFALFHSSIMFDPGPWITHGESWVFWNKPSPIIPRAFDVAPSNHNWLYVGLADKIVKSENGGFDWSVLTDAHGANDICVDPQAGGAIYYWSTDGNLNLMVAGVITSTSLLTETPLDQFGRLARAPDSGMLWAIPNGTTLKRRNLGTWGDQKTGLYGGCGLQAYAGQKLIFLELGHIYISDDSGATITDKTGGWSEFAGPVNAHRLEE